ncbi:MAG: MarR family winged helix-turn-helix transcriptional regulator [Cyclobacteriaceae bacterium]|jgi:DNA-binding MarR family transcriptional regulator|nr:MarR family transcriptional regulator [Flammeovirgaceae bacterium]
MTIEEEIKQPRFRNAHQKAVLNLIFTANWLGNRQRELFEPYGITGQQYNILRILRGQHPKRISGSEIKSRMLDKNSDVSRLLDRLIGKKLVAKNQCPNDKRASDINITEAGLSLLEKLDDALNGMDTRFLKLTKHEAVQLSTLLDKSRG